MKWLLNKGKNNLHSLIFFNNIQSIVVLVTNTPWSRNISWIIKLLTKCLLLQNITRYSEMIKKNLININLKTTTTEK